MSTASNQSNQPWFITAAAVTTWISSGSMGPENTPPCRYTCNMLVAFSNKALLSNFRFRYPFLLTMMHMVTCTISCAVMSSLGDLVPFAKLERYKTIAQLKKIAILSAIFCMSVVFGNISLTYIPVSFNQAISATTPAFTAVLEFFLQSKVQSGTTYATLIPVVAGIVVASRFEPSFHLWGFTACLIATAIRSLKSVVQSMLLEGNEKLPSLSLLAHMAPISAIILIPLTLYNEPESFRAVVELSAGSNLFNWLLAANCCLSFFVNLTNFLVTKYCGALTLQVLGNAKGVVAAAISVLIFHNPVTVMGWVGYIITMFGVVAYSESRKRSAKAVKGKAQYQLLTFTSSVSESAKVVS